jgi:glycosyltransferase involved in cell wall biosynthesis
MVMHWTYPLPLIFEGVANIYTVHDLIPLTHPHLTDIEPARFKRIISRIVSRAAHIVTVSETSRRDIIRLLGVPCDRVTNTYQPVAVDDSPNDPPPERQGHFLFCGTIEARKNVGRLIAAYRASGAQAPLILVGPRGFRADAELAAGGADISPFEALPATACGIRAGCRGRPFSICCAGRGRCFSLPSPRVSGCRSPKPWPMACRF